MLLFVSEVGVVEADEFGSVTFTSNTMEDQFRIFVQVLACMMSKISGTVQWWIYLNSLNLFGCFAALIITVSAPEVMPAAYI